MYVAHIICIYYTYNIYIYAYPWQKNAYKFSRFLCHRTINLAMSYELFLPFLSWDYILIMVFLIVDVVYRAQGKNQVFYKTQ